MTTAFAGSSPRVRGTPRKVQPLAANARFIPACAGNSPAAGQDKIEISVHPRVCGELTLQTTADVVLTGSSPRVRGTPHAPRPTHPHRRFIPACAGNSRGAIWPGRAHPVHPRVCGELLNPTHGICSIAGSSPRVRGTRVTRIELDASPRFIPACAGNSQAGSPYRR